MQSTQELEAPLNGNKVVYLHCEPIREGKCDFYSCWGARLYIIKPLLESNKQISEIRPEEYSNYQLLNGHSLEDAVQMFKRIGLTQIVQHFVICLLVAILVAGEGLFVLKWFFA